MQSDPAYGQKFVSPFRVDSVSQLAVSGPKKSRLLVSRLRRDTPGHGLVMAPQQEGGPVYSVLLQLRGKPVGSSSSPTSAFTAAPTQLARQAS